MKKLDRDKDFDASTYKWRFEVWSMDSSDDGAKYEIHLFRWMGAAENDKELMSVESLHTTMAHAFIENDALYDAYMTNKIKFIQDNASKM